MGSGVLGAGVFAGGNRDGYTYGNRFWKRDRNRRSGNKPTVATSVAGSVSLNNSIAVVTLFPSLVEAVVQHGVTGRAMQNGLLQLVAINPRDFAVDRHRTVDDRPYGGGPGLSLIHI